MPQLKELLIEELRDLLHAETQLTKALPKLAKAARHPKLKEAFENHLRQTEGQLERLNNAFELLGAEATPKPCKGMAGLIQEGDEAVSQGSEKEDLSADLALIAAAQKVEHYEIALYGSLCSFAKKLGHPDAARILHETLEEERKTDEKLTKLAESGVNQKAHK